MAINRSNDLPDFNPKGLSQGDEPPPQFQEFSTGVGRKEDSFLFNYHEAQTLEAERARKEMNDARETRERREAEETKRADERHRERVMARLERQCQDLERREREKAELQSTKKPRAGEGTHNTTRGTAKKSAWKTKPRNAPKGKFIAFFKKAEGTWRFQLLATGESPATRRAIIRVQLWSSPEDGGFPIKDGPGCGFTLSLLEAEKLSLAIQMALVDVKSGSFDLTDDKNALPGRSR